MGSSLTESIEGGLDARNDQSAQEASLRIDDTKSGGGAEVDNDGGCTVTGDGSQGICQTILTQLRGGFDGDGKVAFGIGDTEEMRGESGEVVDGLCHIIIHLGYDGGDDDTRDVCRFHIVFPKSLFEFVAEEGNGFFLARLEAPGVGDGTVVGGQGDDDGGVANVD